MLVYCKQCKITYQDHVTDSCPICLDIKNKRKENVMNDGWEVKIDTVSNCDKMPKEYMVWMEPLVKAKINALMDKFPRIEWLAYLIGEVKEDNQAIITDLHIPKQKITSTSVDDIDCPEFNTLSCIGVIHSHHGMGNGFSGTDHEWINQNHNISLCIANSGTAGQARLKTPCGSLMIVPTKTKVMFKSDLNKEDFLKEIDKKIEKKTYVVYNNRVTNWRQGVKNWFQGANQKHTHTPPKGGQTKSSVNSPSTDDGEWHSGLKKGDEDMSLLDALKEDGLEDDVSNINISEETNNESSDTNKEEIKNEETPNEETSDNANLNDKAPDVSEETIKVEVTDK